MHGSPKVFTQYSNCALAVVLITFVPVLIMAISTTVFVVIDIFSITFMHLFHGNSHCHGTVIFNKL